MKSNASRLVGNQDVKVYIHYIEKGEILSGKGDAPIKPEQLREHFAPVQYRLANIGKELFSSEDVKCSEIVMVGRDYNLGCVSFEAQNKQGHQTETCVALFDPKLPPLRIPAIVKSEFTAEPETSDKPAKFGGVRG